jgi:hypothetical protein
LILEKLLEKSPKCYALFVLKAAIRLQSVQSSLLRLNILALLNPQVLAVKEMMIKYSKN